MPASLELNELPSRKSSRCMWPIPPPPPQKPPTPDLAAHSSWGFVSSKLFSGSPGEYVLGVNKPQNKTSWGSSVEAFAERPIFPSPPSCFLEERWPFVPHAAPAGPQAGCLRRVYR